MVYLIFILFLLWTNWLTAGVYNIVHPYKDKIIESYRNRGGEGQPQKGIGISPEEMIPLSVQGQVRHVLVLIILFIGFDYY